MLMRIVVGICIIQKINISPDFAVYRQYLMELVREIKQFMVLSDNLANYFDFKLCIFMKLQIMD